MLTELRKSDERGKAKFGWLDSRHSFSFGHYYDPKHMGFGPLRVINEDRVVGGGGFPTHPHSNMEIISYVLEGALEHRDSIGTGSIIKPGDLQRMSAGTGVRHSEFNASQSAPVHFLQIWIEPAQKDIPPSYEQKSFSREDKRGKLRLVGSQDGRDGSVKIHQDVDLYSTILHSGEAVTHQILSGRAVWVQVVTGSVEANGQVLVAGDGLALTQTTNLKLSAKSTAEALIFDLIA